MWLEMAKDPEHGGHGWDFKECLWSPSRKKDGARWRYWELLLRVKKGDRVFHLRGEDSQAVFVGHSVADSDGYETRDRPTVPGQWAHANTYYRVPLVDFVELRQPIRLKDVFAERRTELLNYFQRNKGRSKHQKEALFFVLQNGRLQCQFGAYLSEFSSELMELLVGIGTSSHPARPNIASDSVSTDEQLREVKIRQGQARFSAEVRANYGGRCCFPDCDISDDRFLVGAHIARWADAQALRGNISNGLCMCLLHDRAFEMGLFTLTADLRVVAHPTKLRGSRWAQDHIVPKAGLRILPAPTPPSEAALRQHWTRIGFAPS
jgi:putative restriction endonuclease